MSKFIFTATCLFGLEGLLGAEIEKLGYKRTETIDGRISFEGDASAAARCNLWLRYAERLYLNLGNFKAVTFDELFEGTKKIPFEEIIDKNAMFPVKGHSIKSKLFSVRDCQSIIKKAAASRLGNYYGLRTLPEDGIKYQIEFFLFKDNCTIMIDLSGSPLHKRGYRPETVGAPLRETLAAALAALARPREDVILWDPFCGSGTIAIESALMMKNIAPGINRHFCAEKYPVFGKDIWINAREEARASVIADTSFRARATDIDPECVRIARESALRAGVSDVINIYEEDALEIKTEGLRGTIVTNPPYGERLMNKEEAQELYEKMGMHFKTLDRWQIYILTPNEKFPQLYKRRPDKVRKLYNGMIPCYYYQFFKNK